ncbi:Maf family protein [Seohaeicola saemankumensis]|uniref:Nucleoside triphosphate pyrophosphatase n=1 Tax=Seohaeicola saemankumensis TaxID=481181 RepID=A0ABW3TE46_9RHOB
MPQPLILASGSSIRAQMLRQAGLEFEVIRPAVDEDMLRDAMLSEGASPRDLADALAEMKALRVSEKRPEALVIGCDQVLDLGGQVLTKPTTREDAAAQLRALRGKRHSLLSAVVICDAGKPIWRHIGQVRLMVRDFSDVWLEGYLDRNWPDIAESVGAYKLEKEGVRLFSRVEGDYFTVLGLPLLDLLSYLSLRGDIDT